MADTKISALTAATTPLTGAEQVPVVQSATSKQATVGDVLGSFKVAVRVATTAALTGTFTFATANGGTLTWSASAPTTLDGVTLAVGDRILVKDETSTNAPRNGIYVRTSSTVWTRAADVADAAKMAASVVNVLSGTANGGTTWTNSFKNTDTLNTTAVTFSKVLDTSLLSSTNPAALGTAAPGTGTTLARADHVHPTTGVALSGAVTTSGLTQATARLLGRTTASTGAIEEISVGTGLSLASGSLTSTVTSGSSLLARVERTATSVSTYTITSTTNADVDATNLVLPTFTIPSSGSVLIYLYGTFTGTRTYWSLRASTTNVAGTERFVGTTNNSQAASASISITGLTPGATSLAYKWAWRNSGATTSTLYYGNGTTTAAEFGSGATNNGALVMEVWSQ